MVCWGLCYFLAWVVAMVVKPMSSPRKISDAVIDIFAIPTVMSAIERIVRSVVCSFVIVFSFCVCCSGIPLCDDGGVWRVAEDEKEEIGRLGE